MMTVAMTVRRTPTLPTTIQPSTTMTNYEQLHRQCRTLENLLDAKLTSYSQLVSTVGKPTEDVEAGGSSERWKNLEVEVDGLLEKAFTNHRGVSLKIVNQPTS
jgi:hypothetical protein